MGRTRSELPTIFLVLFPVLIAISGLLSEFNILDFSYLSLVVVIYAKYFYMKKHN